MSVVHECVVCLLYMTVYVVCLLCMSVLCVCCA